jgi:hypothetical protein
MVRKMLTVLTQKPPFYTRADQHMMVLRSENSLLNLAQ